MNFGLGAAAPEAYKLHLGKNLRQGSVGS